MRISEEIGHLMKEIETLVEEKTKESLDVSRLTREGKQSGQAAKQLGTLFVAPLANLSPTDWGPCSPGIPSWLASGMIFPWKEHREST